MKKATLVRGARQLLTLHGSATGPRSGSDLEKLGIIEDGSVLIVNGTIRAVGPTRRIENLAEARNAELISASGQIVVPGLVDAHIHLTGLPARNQLRSTHRGYGTQTGELERSQGNLALMQYIRTTTANALAFQAKRYVDIAVRHGTTTLEVKAGTAFNVSGELKVLRAIASLAAGPADIIVSYVAGQLPGVDQANKHEYLQWVYEEIIPRLKDRKAAKFLEVKCGKDSLRANDCSILVDAARRSGMAIKVHVAGGEENSEAIELALSTQAVAVGGVQRLSKQDIDLLGHARTLVTFTPGVPQSGNQSPVAEGLVRQLIDAGAAIALGSGFTPSAESTCSMQFIIFLACAELGMAPEEAITAATVNAAHASGVASRCGSIEFGKQADLCILDIPDYRDLAVRVGTNLISTVIRKGEILYEARTLPSPVKS